MATKICTRYAVMDGEPHLGYQTECEILVTLDEILEEAIASIVADGDIPQIVFINDQNGDEVEIDFCSWERDKTQKGLHINSDYLTEEEYDLIQDVLDADLETAALERLTRTTLYRNYTRKQLFREEAI